MDIKRHVTGLFLGVGWILLLTKGSYFLLWLVLSILGSIALFEYADIVFLRRGKREQILSIVLGLFPVGAAYFGQMEVVAAALFLALLSLFIITTYYYSVLENALEFILRLGFGVLYVGFCLSHIVLVAAREDGGTWLLFLTVITVASDSGAYYTGRALGARKLCPAVSPGKTVEGLIGGVTAGVIAAVIASFFRLSGDGITLSLIFWAVILSGICVWGDLAESVLKRAAGVKDSGAWLPGHGGILDRGDSILLTSPLLYYLLYFGAL